MALIDITPIMTSNTTPAPYIVSASSIYNSEYDAWKAFDNVLNALNSWATSANTLNGWIKIDFGSQVIVDAISLFRRDNAINSIDSMPKSFRICGSNDGVLYDLLSYQTNITNWEGEQEKIYFLPNRAYYRYYRIDILEIYGKSTDACSIGEIKFWQDDIVDEKITNKKASMNCCLASNSTRNIQQRQNDPREGLLGFANDPDERYGTLFIINNKGQAEIPKAAMAKADILFDGAANAVGSYILNGDIYKYSNLLVQANAKSETNNVATNFQLIPTLTINKTIYQYSIGQLALSNYFYQIPFGFPDYNILEIGSKINFSGWADPMITHIYGIK